MWKHIDGDGDGHLSVAELGWASAGVGVPMILGVVTLQ